MTAAINDFVEEWSQHFKPSESENINLEVINLCKEKHNLPLRNLASFIHYWVMELGFRFSQQPIALEHHEALFHLYQCTIP